MSSLDDLKKRATASELTLIHEVEKLTTCDLRSDVVGHVIRFIRTNPPPTRESMMMMSSDFSSMADHVHNWVTRLNEHLDKELGS